MKKFFQLLLVFLFLLFPPAIFAHPGRTAADGCHYCRTNCDYWGVAWNVRHCHGAIAPVPPPKALPSPLPTPKPVVPTPVPTPTLISSPSPSPQISSTPSPFPSPTPLPEPPQSPEVKGVTEEQEVEPLSDAETIGILGFLGVLVGGLGLGIYKLLRKFIVKKKS